jgi:protoheme IX farnesyltransferase
MAPVRKLSAYLELTKPRITLLILLVSAAAFRLGSNPAAVDTARLSILAVAISLLAAGLFALNQYLERDIDARMRRTENRPLPLGRLRPADALWFGVILSSAAIGLLGMALNPLTALLGAATWASYLFLYTPLKRVTPHCTLIGAFPGAAPPLLGWAAVRGELGPEAWVLFSIVFLWQFPHFHSIACLYREDYARADVRLWPVVEESGKTTGRQIVAATTALALVSALPAVMKLAGTLYLAGAVVLGAAFVFFGVRCAADGAPRKAQQLLLASVVYLPVLLGLMVFNSAVTR